MAMVTCAIMANLTYGTAIMMRTYSWYIILLIMVPLQYCLLKHIPLLKHGSHVCTFRFFFERAKYFSWHVILFGMVPLIYSLLKHNPLMKHCFLHMYIQSFL
jgi:hypothetical protein